MGLPVVYLADKQTAVGGESSGGVGRLRSGGVERGSQSWFDIVPTVAVAAAATTTVRGDRKGLVAVVSRRAVIPR